ncbi:leucine-rich repeat domain-containing protein [Candidatus Babeliales bacterium]|nr:leucine-rich repeat domain-containing protein [Candidatus Babeliales bacterium]
MSKKFPVILMITLGCGQAVALEWLWPWRSTEPQPVTIINRDDATQSFQVDPIWSDAYPRLFAAEGGKVELSGTVYELFYRARGQGQAYRQIEELIRNSQIDIQVASAGDLLAEAVRWGLKWPTNLLAGSEAYFSYISTKEALDTQDISSLLKVWPTVRIELFSHLEPRLQQAFWLSEQYMEHVYQAVHGEIADMTGDRYGLLQPLPQEVQDELLNMPWELQAQFFDVYQEYSRNRVQTDAEWYDYERPQDGERLDELINVTVEQAASGSRKSISLASLRDIYTFFDKTEDFVSRTMVVQEDGTVVYRIDARGGVGDIVFDNLAALASMATTRMSSLSGDDPNFSDLLEVSFRLGIEDFQIRRNLFSRQDVRDVMFAEDAIWAQEYIIAFLNDSLDQVTGVENEATQKDLFQDETFLECFRQYHNVMLARAEDTHMSPDDRNEVLDKLLGGDVAESARETLKQSMRERYRTFLDFQPRDIVVQFDGAGVKLSEYRAQGSQRILNAHEEQPGKTVQVDVAEDLGMMILGLAMHANEDAQYKRFIVQELGDFPAPDDQTWQDWFRQKIRDLVQKARVTVIEYMPIAIEAVGGVAALRDLFQMQPVEAAKKAGVAWIGANVFSWVQRRFFPQDYTPEVARAWILGISNMEPEWFINVFGGRVFVSKLGNSLELWSNSDDSLQISHEFNGLSLAVQREIAREYYKWQRSRGKTHQESLFNYAIDYGLSVNDLVDRRLPAAEADAPDTIGRLYAEAADGTKTLDLSGQLLSSTEGFMRLATDGKIPLQRITVVNCSDNMLRNLREIPVDQMTSVRTLNLNNNGIETFDTNFVDSLPPSLVRLDLSENQLRYVSEEAFGRLLTRCPQLSNIVLDGNNLTQSVFDTMNGVVRLQEGQRVLEIIGARTQRELGLVDRFLRALKNFANAISDAFPSRTTQVRIAEDQTRTSVRQRYPSGDIALDAPEREPLLGATETMEDGVDAVEAGVPGLAVDAAVATQEDLRAAGIDAAQVADMISFEDDVYRNRIVEETSEVFDQRLAQEEAELVQQKVQRFQEIEQAVTEGKISRERADQEHERVDEEARRREDEMRARHDREREMRSEERVL